jgi:uncharacterized protein (TIGR00299 family) protein
MRTAYFDCFNGAGGDMIVAALVHAGADAEQLRTTLAGLPVEGYRLSIDPVAKQGISAVRFDVTLDPAPQPHRHLKHLLKFLEEAELPDRVRRRSMEAFRRLAEAEARIHGTTVEKVHFHEVGAVDAILDVTGAMLALDLLGIDRVICSPIPVGSGTVSCSHGVMPIPAPATAELLRGVPLATTDEPGELTTPTAAAVLRSVAESFGPMPAMTLERVGYGAGLRDGKTRPNVLRVLIGETVASHDAAEVDEIVVLETSLDDTTGQVMARCVERLLKEGAWDVWTVPIQMKKGRPGFLLSALCEPQWADALEQLIFAETPTFGIRRYSARRSKLRRRHESVETRFGPIRMKVGEADGRATVSPEYDDCRAAAEQGHATLREVQAAAVIAWEKLSGRSPDPEQ